MLDSLEDIDWSALRHAYGEASGTPEHIRALASDDPDEREEALSQLWMSILHQGSVYSATAPAVPFLIELLGASAVEGKAELLEFVAAIGQSGLDLKGIEFGGPPDEASSDEHDDEAGWWEKQREWAREALEAVGGGANTYLRLLEHPDPRVRIRAAHALSMCRSRAGRVLPRLRALIVSDTHPAVRAAMVFAACDLVAARPAETGRKPPASLAAKGLTPFVARLLGPRNAPVVRLAAALCLIRLAGKRRAPKRASAVAAEVIGEAVEDFKKLPWGDGPPVQRIVRQLEGGAVQRLRFYLQLLQVPGARADTLVAIESHCTCFRGAGATVAPLLRLLLRDPDPRVRWRAAEALRMVGPARDVALPELLEALQDKSKDVRNAAAVALCRVRRPEALPALIPMLESPPDVGFVSSAEGQGEDPHAWHSEDFLGYLVSSIGRFGDAAAPAVPALVHILTTAPIGGNGRVAAANVLGDLGPAARSAVPALVRALKHARVGVRAALALAKIGEEVDAAIDALMRAARSRGRFGGIGAVWALGEIGPPAAAAVPLLEERLTGAKAAGERLELVRALWRVTGRPDKPLPALLAVLRDEREDVRRSQAAEVLGEIGPTASPAVPLLLRQLREKYAWSAVNAAVALWKIKPSDSTARLVANALRKHLGQGPASLVAVQCLADIGPRAAAALPALRAALAREARLPHVSVDEDEQFCERAAGAIAAIEGG